MVSKQALNEFRELYKQEYGIVLDSQTAMELAEKYLLLFKAIYRPIKKQLSDAGKEEYGKQTDVK